MAIKTCKWKRTFNSVADTQCGHVFNNWPGVGVKITLESYAGDQRFIYCPFCGKKIVVSPKDLKAND